MTKKRIVSQDVHENFMGSSGKSKPSKHAKQEAETPEAILREIIATELTCDDELVIANASLVDDLGAESLDIHQIAVEVEERLGIDMDTDFDYFELRTFDDWLRFIESKAKNSFVQRLRESAQGDAEG